MTSLYPNTPLPSHIQQTITQLKQQLQKSKLQQTRYLLQLSTITSIRSKISSSIEELSTSYQRQLKGLQQKVKKLELQNKKLVKKSSFFQMEILNFEKRILQKDAIISAILKKDYDLGIIKAIKQKNTLDANLFTNTVMNQQINKKPNILIDQMNEATLNLKVQQQSLKKDHTPNTFTMHPQYNNVFQVKEQNKVSNKLNKGIESIVVELELPTVSPLLSVQQTNYGLKGELQQQNNEKKAISYKEIEPPQFEEQNANELQQIDLQAEIQGHPYTMETENTHFKNPFGVTLEEEDEKKNQYNEDHYEERDGNKYEERAGKIIYDDAKFKVDSRGLIDEYYGYEGVQTDNKQQIINNQQEKTFQGKQESFQHQEQQNELHELQNTHYQNQHQTIDHPKYTHQLELYPQQKNDLAAQQSSKLSLTQIEEQPKRQLAPPPPKVKCQVPPPKPVKSKTVRHKIIPKYTEATIYEHQFIPPQPQNQLTHSTEAYQNQNHNQLKSTTEQNLVFQQKPQKNISNQSNQFNNHNELKSNEQNVHLNTQGLSTSNYQQLNDLNQHKSFQQKDTHSMAGHYHPNQVQHPPEDHSQSHVSSNTKSKRNKRQPPRPPIKQIVSFEVTQIATDNTNQPFTSQRTQKNTTTFHSYPQNQYHPEIHPSNYQTNFLPNQPEDHDMHGLVDESSIEQIDDVSMISGPIFPEDQEYFDPERLYQSSQNRRKHSGQQKLNSPYEQKQIFQNQQKQKFNHVDRTTISTKKMPKKKAKRENVQMIDPMAFA